MYSLHLLICPSTYCTPITFHQIVAGLAVTNLSRGSSIASSVTPSAGGGGSVATNRSTPSPLPMVRTVG